MFLAQVTICLVLLQNVFVKVPATQSNTDISCIDNEWQHNFTVVYSHRNLDHFFCDFDTISLNNLLKNNLSLFYSNYYDAKPLLIKADLSEWSNITFWKKSNFISKYGDRLFNIGESIDIVTNDGNALNAISLTEYINNIDEKYIFDREIWSELVSSDNFANFKHLKLWKNFIENGGVFMFSSSNKTGTGTSFHKHGNAFIGMISGRKRVFLYPPYISPIGGYPPSFSTLIWYKKVYKYLDKNIINDTVQFDFNDIDNVYYEKAKSLFDDLSALSNINDVSIKNILNLMESTIFTKYKPIECIINSGDILYIPQLYWHSVLNLGDTMAISIQNDDDKNINQAEKATKLTQFMLNGGGSVGHYFAANGAMYHQGNYHDAIKYFIKCILMDPLFTNCYKGLYHLMSQNVDDLEIQTTATKVLQVLNLIKTLSNHQT